MLFVNFPNIKGKKVFAIWRRAPRVWVAKLNCHSGKRFIGYLQTLLPSFDPQPLSFGSDSTIVEFQLQRQIQVKNWCLRTEGKSHMGSTG
ncbi:hypothetical protein RCL_jg13943.t1 [Rhizophagus clarus]|uniref:Uncharacterized protein n=1 Tax=Rhizophagus clarus TaxID=94130 RepID=A0A8H3QUB0_9GLOM|nr:hypothetical protein RCL_jg13943.t1 [Rhizophagus clarus]